MYNIFWKKHTIYFPCFAQVFIALM